MKKMASQKIGTMGYIHNGGTQVNINPQDIKLWILGTLSSAVP